jgi:hypothetical protein
MRAKDFTKTQIDVGGDSVDGISATLPPIHAEEEEGKNN